MKNKFCLLGLLGFAGVLGGAFLQTRALWAFAAFFPLALLFWVEKGERFDKMISRVCARTLVFGLIACSGVMFIGGLLMRNDFIRRQMPFDILALLYGSCLAWCFAATVVVFVVQTIVGAVWITVRKGASV